MQQPNYPLGRHKKPVHLDETCCDTGTIPNFYDQPYLTNAASCKETSIASIENQRKKIDHFGSMSLPIHYIEYEKEKNKQRHEIREPATKENKTYVGKYLR